MIDIRVYENPGTVLDLGVSSYVVLLDIYATGVIYDPVSGEAVDLKEVELDYPWYDLNPLTGIITLSSNLELTELEVVFAYSKELLEDIVEYCTAE